MGEEFTMIIEIIASVLVAGSSQTRSQGMLHYIREAGVKSFWDAWNLVFERSLASSMTGIAIFLSSLWFLRHKRRHEEAKLRLREFLEAAALTGAAFLLIWIFYFAVVTPNQLLDESRTAQKKAEDALKATPTVPAQVTLIQKDPETLSEVTALRSENAKLKSQVSALDPLQQPIAGASAVAQILIKLDKKLNNHFMDKGARIALAKGSEGLLEMSVGDSYGQVKPDGNVLFAALFNTPPVGPLMGEPVKNIRDVEYVQVEFMVDEMPAGAQVVGGTVVFTINGNQRFEFTVPEQVADEKKVFIRDLSSLKNRLAPSEVMP